MKLKNIIENGKNSKLYKDFEDVENELNFYRDYVQPMTDEQGNKFRHIAGSARMTQKHNPFIINFYGLGKEAEDYFIKKKSLKDSLTDLKNNLYGSLVGQVVRNAEPQTLYDWIFKSINNDN